MPEGLGVRGAALWSKLGQVSEHDPSGVLALEACRTADRLDRLEDALGGGGEWLQVITSGDGSVSLVIDKMLVEARLQAAALKTLLESPVLKVAKAGEADPVDELARTRAARRAATTGQQ